MVAGMTEARFRITIKSQAGTTIQPEHDAAAGAFMLGAARAAVHLGCQALYVTRKAVVLETTQEPSAEHLQAFQTLGDAYYEATGGAGRTYFDRVTVEGIAGLSADDVQVLAAAKRAREQPGSSVTRFTDHGSFVVVFAPLRREDTLGYRASEVLAFVKELSGGLTDAEAIQAIEAHPNVHDCTVRHSDSGERFFVFRVKPSDLDLRSGDQYKRTRYEVDGATMHGA